MARAAGSSSHYQLAIVDGKGRVRSDTIGFPSVTTILGALPKNGLDWYGYKLGCEAVIDYVEQGGSLKDLDGEGLYEALKKAKRITPYTNLKKAGGRGTTIHDLAERLLTTGEMGEVPEELQGYATALVDWYTNEKQYKSEVIAVEAPLFSLSYKYAGTVDAILKRQGHYVVLDFKTSKGIYESHLLQGTAYEAAAREMGIIPPEHPLSYPEVVRLGADGKFEVKQSLFDIEDFLTVQKLWSILNRKSVKK
jgi:hypothetical protein